MFRFRDRKAPMPDEKYALREAARSLDLPSRRLFMRQAVGLGSLTMLTGCQISDELSVSNVLRNFSEFNDKVQAKLFNPARLAPEYPASRIVDPFPFNSFYQPNQPNLAPDVDVGEYRLFVDGKVESDKEYALDDIYRLPIPLVSQVTEHICIEGWSAIGKWTGFRFSDFLKYVGADITRPYVNFRCVDTYVTSIDMETALHPQTQLTLYFGVHNIPLPKMYGFPMKVRIPTKLGFKNPKHVINIEISDESVGGYWETYGYNWFSGL